MEKREFFKIEGNAINRIRKFCPKCGPGVFIGEHKDRFSCGKCGYTEFKSGANKNNKLIKDEKSTLEKSKEQSPAEQKTQEKTDIPQNEAGSADIKK